VKYLIDQLQLQAKRVLLLATTGATTLPLSPHAHTMHSMFKIPIRGYLIIIIELISILKMLKQAYLIVIDEMSMMTSIVLCAIE
jgi:hypothetical protein